MHILTHVRYHSFVQSSKNDFYVCVFIYKSAHVILCNLAPSLFLFFRDVLVAILLPLLRVLASSFWSASHSITLFQLLLTALSKPAGRKMASHSGQWVSLPAILGSWLLLCLSWFQLMNKLKGLSTVLPWLHATTLKNVVSKTTMGTLQFIPDSDYLWAS